MQEQSCVASLTSCLPCLASSLLVSVGATLSLCATEQTPSGLTTSQGTLLLCARSTCFSCTVGDCASICCRTAARACTRDLSCAGSIESTLTIHKVGEGLTCSNRLQRMYNVQWFGVERHEHETCRSISKEHTLSAALCCIARSKLRIRPRNTKTPATVKAMIATILVFPLKGPTSSSLKPLFMTAVTNQLTKTEDHRPTRPT